MNLAFYRRWLYMTLWLPSGGTQSQLSAFCLYNLPIHSAAQHLAGSQLHKHAITASKVYIWERSASEVHLLIVILLMVRSSGKVNEVNFPCLFTYQTWIPSQPPPTYAKERKIDRKTGNLFSATFIPARVDALDTGESLGH